MFVVGGGWEDGSFERALPNSRQSSMSRMASEKGLLESDRSVCRMPSCGKSLMIWAIVRTQSSPSSCCREVVCECRFQSACLKDAKGAHLGQRDDALECWRKSLALCAAHFHKRQQQPHAHLGGGG